MAKFKFAIPRPTRQNPRKVVTGTTYTATGHAELPTPQVGSELGSAYVTPTTAPPVEIVPQLTSAYTRSVTFAQMMNDSSVDVSVRVWKTPVLGADLFVDPYDDLPLNIEIADFIWANLAGGMESPLLESLQDILHMCEDGYSLLEKVYENREWTPPGQGRNTKNYTMLKCLAFRPTNTIKDVTYDNNGRLAQITQGAIQADKSTKDAVIPATKLLVFTLNKKGGDITGKSLLRTAYSHWYYKTHFYKIDAIQKERHGIGVPRGKLLPGYNKQDRQILSTMLRNIRTNEESFIIQTPNVEIDFAELSGQLVNALESADHHSMMILLNVMAAFIGMGTGVGASGGGSRAVGSTQTDIFMKALTFIAQYVCQIINMYIIPELVVYNYKTTSFPQLRVRNIGDTRDLQMLGGGLSNLISQGGITMHLATEQWIRKTFDMPAKQNGQAAYPEPTTLQPATDPNAPPVEPAVTNGNGTAPVQQLQTGARADKGGVVTQRDSAGNSGKPPNATH